MGIDPKEKNMCKTCWTKLSTFHELYRLVKTNYNTFIEENVPEEVIVINTEEEKIKGEENFKNTKENELNYLSIHLRNTKL